MSVLVDSNILIDIFVKDKHWFSWSCDILQSLALQETLYINPIIYAEISISFQEMDDLEKILPDFIRRADLPYEACFLAGKCFLEYRKRGGQKTSPLPDFFIGSHAFIKNWTLVSRDKGRYETYFPHLKLITP